jgi:hypothetical protein
MVSLVSSALVSPFVVTFFLAGVRSRYIFLCMGCASEISFFEMLVLHVIVKHELNYGRSRVVTCLSERNYQKWWSCRRNQKWLLRGVCYLTWPSTAWVSSAIADKGWFYSWRVIQTMLGFEPYNWLCGWQDNNLWFSTTIFSWTF